MTKERARGRDPRKTHHTKLEERGARKASGRDRPRGARERVVEGYAKTLRAEARADARLFDWVQNERSELV